MTKIDRWRESQQDLRAAKEQKNRDEFQSQIGRAIIAKGLTSPWSGRVNHAFAEVWEAEFLTLWEKTLSRLLTAVEQTKDEAREEAEGVIEDTEPIAYG